MENDKLAKLATDTIRLLSAEAIQKANSGHPGMPMGCADFAYVLWNKYLKHNPKNPSWMGRDRFVLSAGHGSMLIYSLLHMFEYGVTMEDIKDFRQWGSLTPGHPEHGHTAGVDVTTGPLGSGFASAVGMAIAKRNFTSTAGLDNTELFKDQKIYVIAGDGCIQEGTTAEAASLAGHLKLDELVVFYDDNDITIEGKVNLAFSENVKMRFESYGWRVIEVDDANDVVKVDKALAEAQNADGRPTLIIGKTKIGFGSPSKEGSESCHGAPLGEDELAATRKQLGLEDRAPFTVAEELKEMFSARVQELVADAEQWEKEYSNFLNENPESAKTAKQLIEKPLPENLLEELKKVIPTDKAVATRVSSGKVLQKVAELVPAIAGGAADLAPSTKSQIDSDTAFSPENPAGRNIHFGVRELGMGMVVNGMALYGTSIPFASTFFVFCDYMKPAIRLAALQKLNIVYIFTHDSFYVGEDGPTHQPIEQLAMLRTIPDLSVIRPADANEAAYAWDTALKTEGPVALILTRQNLEPISKELVDNINLSKGAYVLSDDTDFEYILIATGSEVNLALDTASKMRAEGKKVRVVSMPSQELFEKQPASYKEEVLPKSCKKRVTIEAASTFGWAKYSTDEGLTYGLDNFGASAPATVLKDKFGFTTDALFAKIKEHFSI
jgi:transketolase